MGRRIVYCEGCGLRLSEDDFQLGKAGVHLLRPFCVPCKPLPPAVVEGSALAVRRFQATRLRRIRRLPPSSP